MIQVLIAPALIVGLVVGLLAWRVVRDHAQERALAVRAEVQSAVNRALEGESLLAVHVEPASSFHPGRVVLSTPMGYEWLVHEAWNPLIEDAPQEYAVMLCHAAGRHYSSSGSAHPCWS